MFVQGTLHLTLIHYDMVISLYFIILLIVALILRKLISFISIYRVPADLSVLLIKSVTAAFHPSVYYASNSTFRFAHEHHAREIFDLSRRILSGPDSKQSALLLTVLFAHLFKKRKVLCAINVCGSTQTGLLLAIYAVFLFFWTC